MTGCNNIPSKLYHYAEFNDFTKDALLNRYIYLAAPNNENDDDELKVEVEKNECLMPLNEVFEGMDFQFYGDVRETDSLISGQYDMVQEIRNNLTDEDRKNAGIYCLTDSHEYENMWVDYAHNDLCLEFDTAELLRSIDYCHGGIFNKVRYVSNRKIDIFEEAQNPWISYFIKTSEWENEVEYRYININAISMELYRRKLRFSSNALTGIYYGSSMDADKMRELNDILNRSYYTNARLFNKNC